MTEEPKLNEFMSSGGLGTFSLRYYSAEVEASFLIDEASFLIDDEQTVEPSLQVVYDRSFLMNGKQVDQSYWLYFAPEDARAIGSALLAWGEANKEETP